MQTQFTQLQGKWAVILGASSGFGAATAKALSKAGMNICGVHLDRKAGMEAVDVLKKDLESQGSKILFYNINASDPEKRIEVLQNLKDQNIMVHTLFHSLAFGTLKPFIGAENETIGQKQMDMTLDVMAHSLVYWTQSIHREGLFEKGGRIFAMTSAGSSRVWKSYGAVSAAKSSLESHIRQLSLELAPDKITANAICAGVTDTPALRKIPGNEEMIAMATQKNPYKRLTTPDDIAQATVGLCLPNMGWMTGNVLNIDGGEIITD